MIVLTKLNFLIIYLNILTFLITNLKFYLEFNLYHYYLQYYYHFFFFYISPLKFSQCHHFEKNKNKISLFSNFVFIFSSANITQSQSINQQIHHHHYHEHSQQKLCKFLCTQYLIYTNTHIHMYMHTHFSIYF